MSDKTKNTKNTKKLIDTEYLKQQAKAKAKAVQDKKTIKK